MKPHAAPTSSPDRAAALQQYRRRAGIYDLELMAFEPIRRLAVQRLALRRGDAVLDLGCGTGLSLALLRDAVGARGQVIAIEQCPEMIEQARRRVAEQRWRNVTLLCAPVESVQISGSADAALFHFTHDILCRREAVDQVLDHLGPGARVVATGLKWSRSWVPAANFFVWAAALHSVTSMQGLDRPWRSLERRLGALEVESMWLDSVYVARGLVPAVSGSTGS